MQSFQFTINNEFRNVVLEIWAQICYTIKYVNFDGIYGIH